MHGRALSSCTSHVVVCDSGSQSINRKSPLVLRPCQRFLQEKPATLRTPRHICCSVETEVGPRGAFQEDTASETRQQLFNRIAPVYDKLNDALSLGQHRVWKRVAVKWSGVMPGDTALDVCCGSGDLAFRLAEAVGPSGQVFGLDFAAEMLADASARQAEMPSVRKENMARVKWIQGDALSLPLEDNSIDAATMGYGLRNVASIPGALRELYRVLKPGSSVSILDFNNSQDTVTDAVQGFFLEKLVVPVATAYGLAEEYEYLRPSIKRFMTGTEQEEAALGVGFESAVHFELGFGLMGALVARK